MYVRDCRSSVWELKIDMFRARSRTIVAAVALSCLMVPDLEGRAPGATTESPAAPQVSTQFPVRANGGTLVDVNGVPFPILGRVCWIVMPLSVADYRFVLDDTAAKGFNSIEVKAPITGRPDGNGNLAFLKRLDGANWTGQVLPYNNINAEAPDFTTPNEAFWAGVDAFFAYAEQKGLLVFWFPAYVGYHNTDWWMEMMVANGSTKMRTYGAWVANRYRNQKNLVWMIGGDKGTGQFPFNASEMAVETAFVEGLKSVTTVAGEYSAEWLRGSITKDLLPQHITLNGTYASATDIINQGSRAWAWSPRVPAFAQEYPFEDLQGTGNVRPLTMYAWLSTIGGYLFGNGIFTSFEPNPDYRNYMNTPGTQNAQRLNAFIKSIPWHTLVPNNSAIVAGQGSTGNVTYIASARSTDGTLYVAYRPPNHTGSFTVNMSVMSGTSSARWWDPMSGAYANDASGLPNSGNRSFTPPGNNSAGSTDWMLVLSAGGSTTPPPPAAPTNVRIVR